MIYSFIIVNYNTKEITSACINSIFDNSNLKDIEFEIIIIDNNSTDGSEEYIISQFPTVIYKYNRDNLGFGKANNIGAKIATGDYLVFINSDTIALDTDFYELYKIISSKDSIGFLGCKILNADNSIQSIGYDFPSLMNELRLRILFWNFNFVKKFRFSKYVDRGVKEVDWISGCFMIVERELFFMLNGFDDKIFMYSEDLDICLSASKLGKKNYVYDKTQIYHLHGKSGNKKNPSFKQQITRKENYFYVIKKHDVTKFIILIKMLVYLNTLTVFYFKKISYNINLVQKSLNNKL